MFHRVLHKLEKLSGWFAGTRPCPVIRWAEVIGIIAIGTDAVGPFEVSITFVHADGSRVALFAHHESYDEIIESLSQRFPSIPPEWYAEMMREQPWAVERVVYLRNGCTEWGIRP